MPTFRGRAAARAAAASPASGVGSLSGVADEELTAGLDQELDAIEADLAAVEAALATLDDGGVVDLGDLPDDAPAGALAERLASDPPA